MRMCKFFIGLFLIAILTLIGNSPAFAEGIGSNSTVQDNPPKTQDLACKKLDTCLDTNGETANGVRIFASNSNIVKIQAKDDKGSEGVGLFYELCSK